ncbi:MAG: hypothetical protein FD146_364 [Anaerolineaceae bacterium]|nr:MAG: hypothetical protein FD146_364 [Anaerolineaceae bacterium]
MKKKTSLSRVLFNALRIVVPLALIGYLLSRVDWAAAWPYLQQMDWWCLPVSAGLFTLSQVVIAVRWHFLLRFQKLEIPFARLLGLVFVGAFASNFLPTTIGGDVVKMAGAAQGEKKRGVIVASVAADRLYNLAGMVLLLPLALTLEGLTLPGLGRGGLLPVLGLAGWMGWPKLRERLVRTWREVRKWFVSPACVLPALALSWLSIGLAFASFWVIALGVGIHVSYWQASGIAELSYFVALIPIAINGLGILEGSVTYLLVLQGASLEQAVAAALLSRLVTMSVSLLGGVRLFFGWRDLLNLAGQRKAENHSQNDPPLAVK